MYNGYIINIFHRQQKGKSYVYAIGVLDSGQTFGLVNTQTLPCFYIRNSDIPKVEELLDRSLNIYKIDWTTMDGEEVSQISSNSPFLLRNFARKLSNNRIRTYEVDVLFTNQFLIDNGIRRTIKIVGLSKAGKGVDLIFIDPKLSSSDWEPKLKVLSINISTIENTDEIYAISFTVRKDDIEEVHLVGKPLKNDPSQLKCYDSERMLLRSVISRIKKLDPDIITGWSSINDELLVLQNRAILLDIDFNIGRTVENIFSRKEKILKNSSISIEGRQILNALHLVKTMPRRFNDNQLNTIAKSILNRGNVVCIDENNVDDITDRDKLYEYFIENPRLVCDILTTEGLIDLTIKRSILTGIQLDHAWGSVSAFDFLYISELHKKKTVAPTNGVDRPKKRGAPGGLVLSPKAGLYKNIFVFDFKSLYPSIIRTFNIDPLSRIKGENQNSDLIIAPNATGFHRQIGILPKILDSFFSKRNHAKLEGNELASYTYKILMNSFYGVLGTSYCRFATGHLTGAITEFSHDILRWTRDLFIDKGYKVIYGDTDSLFIESDLSEENSIEVLLSEGRRLSNEVNSELDFYLTNKYKVTSYLELEFEKVYTRFFLPYARGQSEFGRAKGYAGIKSGVNNSTLEIVGMEAIRRDWTDLAHDLQRGLLDLIFTDSKPELIEEYVFNIVVSLRNRKKDDDLVYHKNLRKPVASYTASNPPHVKAARLLKDPSGVIHYIITIDGPQPIGYITSPINYDHYVKKQIEPIVRMIAQIASFDIEAAIKGKLQLFRDI